MERWKGCGARSTSGTFSSVSVSSASVRRFPTIDDESAERRADEQDLERLHVVGLMSVAHARVVERTVMTCESSPHGSVAAPRDGSRCGNN
jgi:hypothetical protein